MIKSEQRIEIGEKSFSKLQQEVKDAKPEELEEFLKVLNPDNMGFYGREGIDNAD